MARTYKSYKAPGTPPPPIFHEVSATVNYAIRSSAFRVKALVKVVRHSVVIHGFNFTRNIHLRTLLESHFFDSKNTHQ